MRKLSIVTCMVVALLGADGEGAESGRPPEVGEKVIDAPLRDIEGKDVHLREITDSDGPMVLVVLRGFPGYQCPICMLQFGDILAKEKEFAAKNATVVFVYPGPEKNLDQKAREFIKGKSFPKHFRFWLDPDYRFTNAWNLRWDAPRETAYPSSFVADDEGKILFAKISKTHGGRTKTKELLDAIPGGKED